MECVDQQEEPYERDLFLASFVDAVSGPGMLRYSIRDKLVPLLEQRIFIAQRLGAKDMEANAYDDLGIKCAYLCYHREAIELFKRRLALQVRYTCDFLVESQKSYCLISTDKRSLY